MSQPTLTEILPIIAEADLAMDTLNAARREQISQYNERLRKLRDLKITLHNARSGANGESFKLKDVITQEICRLLADPCHSL